MTFLLPAGSPATTGVTLDAAASWTVVGAVAAAAAVLLGYGLWRGGGSPWGYRDPEGGGRARDLRIDLLRGLAITFVVLNHVTLASLWQLLTQETVGAVSGAELFVAISGVVLGIVYRARVAVGSLADAVLALLARAWKLYYTAVFVVLSVYLLALLPGTDGEVVTTYSETANSVTGEGDAPVYDLYPNIERFADYPVPGYVFRHVLLLEWGPWQFNVMGLYVVLLLVTPLLLWALVRRAWFVPLALSWALYAYNAVEPTRLLPSQFEDSFPLLTWQVLFVHGLVVGYHRERLLRWAGTAVGRAVVALIVVGALALAVFAWNNPYLAHAYDVRLGLVDESLFEAVYTGYFDRTYLEIGRLLNVFALLVAAYAFLTVFWRPVHRAVGWFLVPLGQATLYVFIAHVYFALLVGSLPGVGGDAVLLNTLVHTLVLVALWLMVRKRFLFRYVPR